MAETLEVHSILSMPFAENTYLARRASSREVVVIDPGLQPELILEYLKEKQLTPVMFLNTHGHADHIGGNAIMKRSFPDVPLLIGAGDAHMLTSAAANLSALFGMPITSPPADRLVQEGDTVEAAGLTFEVMEVPGHSPGHVAFLYRGEPCLLFGGDILFRGGVGRFDFPGSNGQLLFDGIKQKVLTLPADTIVYPGHGPETTVGEEKAHNPFVGDGAMM